MFYQIEITTCCNFRCFYCAGRNLPQQHMSWTLFLDILTGIPDLGHTVSLQGEGEPCSHPRFWDMVAAVHDRGHVPYTITNGTIIEPNRLAQAFPAIGISLDTLDPLEAERIGRLNLPVVLANLTNLLDSMSPERIHIMTVDFGQPLHSLHTYLRSLGLHMRWKIQKLQRKDDYARRYPGRVPAIEIARPPFSCRYLEHDRMRFYDVAGREYPCCFIKDFATHEPIPAITAMMAAGKMPDCCRGCREIYRSSTITAAP